MHFQSRLYKISIRILVENHLIIHNYKRQIHRKQKSQKKGLSYQDTQITKLPFRDNKISMSSMMKDIKKKGLKAQTYKAIFQTRYIKVNLS